MKIPCYLGTAPDAHFAVPNIADFTVVSGLDPFGENIEIEANPYRAAPKSPNTVAVALNEMVAAMANTASASTVATTVRAAKAE